MYTKVSANELSSRLLRLRRNMDKYHSGWEIAVIFSKINLFYLTGTMQEGMLVIPRQEDATLWVRRSYERAINESLFPNIKPMDSYRDAAGSYPAIPKSVYLETEFVPLAMLQRFQKYFPFDEVKSLDYAIAITRAVKSTYELGLMEEAGKIHREILEEHVPFMLKQGMSEVELAGELYAIMLKKGHHGLVRFGMFDTEVVLGHIAFGESSIYPTSFNGPGGNYGMSPAVPLLGNRKRLLKRGDLVFVDIGLGVNGYHTDKTMTYMFGKQLPLEAIKEHIRCVEIQDTIASMLVPGAIPSKIYEEVMNSLEPSFLENFMGYGSRQVKFLGHGIGLTIDEVPVIAKGFDEPLEENMVLALEPKKGIKDIGMVGIENTFVVTPKGGRCITGDNKGLINVF
jgi:Xaa-Pro dipeptidase